MNATVKELIELVKGMSQEEAMAAVNQYFTTTEFSLIIDEWNNKMSEKEKANFINALLTYKK